MSSNRYKVKDLGLSTVYRTDDPAVDVVFVHGLNGNAYGTWSTKHPEVFWPGDLLPQALAGLQVRILTYGYDANVASFTDGTSKDKLHNHAERFAAALCANRNLDNGPERPIIFVAHSLGGLVVKRMLIQSEHVKHEHILHLRSIYVSTYGILFLGTPHNGSDVAKWGSLLQSICSAVLPRKFFDSSPQLIQSLRRDNEILQNINREFLTMIERFRIFFFHESKPMDLRGTRAFIVDESSAAPMLDGVERMGIEADHSAMCRFEDRTSPGYDVVADAIQRYARDAPRTITTRWAEERTLRQWEMELKARQFHNQRGFDYPVTESVMSLPGEALGSIGNSIISLPGATEPESRDRSRSLLTLDIDHRRMIQDSQPLLVAPPGFHPNSVFIGMEKELEQLHTRLFKAKKRAAGSVSVLVYGGPGSGKSHLARQYAFTHLQEYPGGVFWVDSKTPEARSNCYWDIAQAISNAEGSDDPRWRDKDTYVASVTKWLVTRENWLLVFDGILFENEEELNEFRKFLPFSKNTSIIYTSVDRTLSKKQRLYEPFGLQVKPLSVPEARKLLFKGLGIKQPTDVQVRRATELVGYYECLPLAIHAIGHRLSATGKAIEHYHIESHLTDRRLAESYQGIMKDLQQNQHSEALNLINLLSFFDHHVPVAMIQLGRKALADFNLEVRSTERGRATQRHMDNTFGILIRYGLIERALDPYPSTDRSEGKVSPGSKRKERKESYRSPTPELDDSQVMSSQESSSSTSHGSIDIIKIHTVVQGFFRDELQLQSPEQFNWWLVVATRVICLSYSNAMARMNATQSPGLVRDYREYDTHAKRLLHHYPKASKLTDNFRAVRHALEILTEQIENDISARSPASSRETFRRQKSIFDRTSSTSSGPSTPTSESSRSNWEGDGDKTESPLEIAFDHGQAFAANLPQVYQPYYRTISQEDGDTGYESDKEGGTAGARSPAMSQDTEVPTATAQSQADDEGGWQVVGDTRPPKASKPKFFWPLRLPLRRMRGHKNLGDFRPVAPVVSAENVAGSTSRLERTKNSDARAALTAMHHSNPQSQIGEDSKLGDENRPTYATVLARNARSRMQRSPPRLKQRQSSNADSNSDGGGAFLRGRAGNQPCHLPVTDQGGSEVMMQSAYSDPGMQLMPRHSPDPYRSFSPPQSQLHSRHPSRSSVASAANFASLQEVNEDVVPFGHPHRPLAYESNVTIDKPPRRPKSSSALGKIDRSLKMKFGMPSAAELGRSPPVPSLPPGYSSQPMSRDVSTQSEQSLHTEPTRCPPKFSPAPVSGRSASPRVDPRAVLQQLQFGAGELAGEGSTSNPASPTAPFMLHGPSGPGMIVGSADGLSRSLVEFSNYPSTEHLRFGDFDPINVEAARQRSEGQYEHTRRRGNMTDPSQTPYPSRNLMPTASDMDPLSLMISEPHVVEKVHRLARSGSSPATANVQGLGLSGYQVIN